MLATDLMIASRNLLRHTRRNLFLAIAIGAVTLLLVVMSALIAGMERGMLLSATTLMTGHVNVGGFFKITSGSAVPLVTDYEKVLADVKREVPELSGWSARGRGYGKAVSETTSTDLVLAGIDVDQETQFREVIRVKEGRLEDLARPDTILLFEDQAKRLEVKVGDALTISAPTTRGASNTADVRVAAIARNMGLLSSFNAYVPMESLRRLYQLAPTTTGALHLYLKDPAVAPQVAARLRDALAKDGWRVMDADPQPYWQKLYTSIPSTDWVGQKLDVTTWKDELTFMSWILSSVQGLTAILLVVLLAIVVIGILNTLAIAIRERTREIGTLRAIGMQRRKVLWLFMLETFLLGLGGTVGGALLGVALAAGVNAAAVEVPEAVQLFLLQQRLTLAVLPAAVIQSVLIITFVTTAAAFFPALRAARLKPVTAMHHLG